MKKFKPLIVFLLSIFILNGCFTKEKPNNSAGELKPSIEEAAAINNLLQPKATNETSNENEAANSSNNQVKEVNGFVLLSSLDKDLIIDLKYATADNFTKKVIYPNSICVLRKNTAEKLVNASTQLKKLGYRIKVWDAYRPVYVQEIFWDIVPKQGF